MGEIMTRQREDKLSQKLVYENTTRVLYVSLVCAILVPVLLLITKSATGELTGLLRGSLRAFEVIDLVFVGLAFFSAKNLDYSFMKVVYRSYWAVFAGFSFVVIYADMTGGNGYLYYCTMLAVLSLVPLVTISEQIYFLVAEIVFIAFLSIRFGVTSKGIFDLVVINAVFFMMSRFAFRKRCEEFSLRERIREMKESNLQDNITGLQNRKAFDVKVNNAVRECLENRRRISILMIDIDDMKKFNSEFGADKGDALIRRVAETIKGITARNTDMLCRLEGGRFLVCMEGGDDMTPAHLAEKIRSTVEHKGIRQSRSATASIVTVSIGVASTILRGEDDFDDICEEAEEAMFDAKSHGKNIVVYDERIYGRDTYGRAAY